MAVDSEPRDTSITVVDGRDAIGDDVEAHAILARVSSALFDDAVEPLQVGRYRLDRRLGQGGFGVVFLAYDPDLGRRVAVKILRPRGAATDAVRQRFVREARVLASVLDPGLAAVFDVGVAPSVPALASELGSGEVFYIVMEYVEGGDLAQWLDDTKRSWREVVDLFIRAGAGLLAAHRRDITHRDFKPSNVLIGNDGSVKVADFGLAQAMGSIEGESYDEDTDGFMSSSSSQWFDSSEDVTLTRTGMVLGTPMYMAPEQHAGERVGPAADQYAFCVALFKALTGRYPFLAGPVAELAQRKRAETLEPWPATTPVPAWVRRIVERGLRRNPGDRFPSMDVLLQRLRKSPAKRLRAASTWILLPGVLAGAGYVLTDRTQPATVALSVESSEGGAVEGVGVWIDGERVGGETSFEVTPGRHLIEVEASQHQPTARAIEASAGGDIEVELRLQREFGVVNIVAEPSSARIVVDGVDHGSRLRDFPIPTGRHLFEVELEGHFTRTFTWDIEPRSEAEAYVVLGSADVWEYALAPPVGEHRWIDDATGDGLDDVFAVQAGTAMIIDPWGDASVQTARLARDYHPGVRVADLDGDARPELVSHGPFGDVIHLAAYDLSEGGLEQPRWVTELPFSTPETFRRDVHVVGQGASRLVVIADVETIKAFDARDGSLRWTRTFDAGVGAFGGLGDGVWVRHESGTVVLDAEGRSLWETALAVNPIVVDDVDTDGVQDAVLVDRVNESVMLHSGASGEVRWARPLDGALQVLARALTSTRPGLVMVGLGRARAVDLRSGEALWSNEGEHWVPQSDVQTSVHRVGMRSVIAVKFKEQLTMVDALSGEILRQLAGGENLSIASGDFNGDELEELLLGRPGEALTFLDESFESAASVRMEQLAGKLVGVRDANRDGSPDMLFRNDRCISVLSVPATEWTVSSSHSFRAEPRLIERNGVPTLLTTVNAKGSRHFAHVDGRTGEVEVHPMTAGADLHRPMVTLEVDDDIFAYLCSGSAIWRFDARTGAELSSLELGGHIYSTPTVVDVDNDGTSEIVFGRFDHGDPVLYVADHKLERVLRTVPVSNYVWAQVDAQDITGDGRDELIAYGLHGIVEVIEPAQDFATLWTSETLGRINFAGAVVRTHGQAESVVVGIMRDESKHDTLVFLDAHTGEVQSSHEGWGARGSAPLAFDIDADGIDDVFAANGSGELRRFEGSTQEPLWTRTLVPDTLGATARSASGPLGWGQFDYGAMPVVVVPWRDGGVTVVDARSGRELRRFAGGARVEARPLVADVDGDGKVEVVIGTHSGKLFALRGDAATWRELSGTGLRP